MIDMKTKDVDKLPSEMESTLPTKGQDICGTCHKPINQCTCAKKGAGAKFDGEKLQWGLLPIAEVEDIVQVLTEGAHRYAPNNWQKVPNGRERYYDALMRHMAEWKKGNLTDKDSGRSHLSHAACCLLFLMWLDKNT